MHAAVLSASCVKRRGSFVFLRTPFSLPLRPPFTIRIKHLPNSHMLQHIEQTLECNKPFSETKPEPTTAESKTTLTMEPQCPSAEARNRPSNAPPPGGTNRNPQPARYQYTPIDSSAKEIRLLILYPGNFNDKIRISIHTAHLTNPPPRYEALSYAWGSEDNPELIPIDSAYSLPVTPNLACALRHLRSGDPASPPRTLWVDAVTIDQTNIPERSEQVPLMGEIYSRAEHVVIWVGPEVVGDDSRCALRLLAKAAHLVRVDWYNSAIYPSEEAQEAVRRGGDPALLDWGTVKVTLREIGKREQRALWRFFRRLWFERLWVRQEMKLAKKKTLVCGRMKMEWEKFARGVLCFHTQQYVRVGGEFDNKFLYMRALVYSPWWSESQWTDYTRLRRELRMLRWKDPRDAIYATRHLLKPGHRSLEFVPDYARPVGEVYEEVATRLAVEHGDLSFLGSCELGSSSIAGLATWIPDWSTSMKYWGLLDTTWSACGWITTHAQSISPGVLRVTGIRMASVEKTQGMPRTPVIDINGMCHDTELIVDTIKAFLPQSQEALEEEYVGGGTLLEAYCLALHDARTTEFFDGYVMGKMSMPEAKKALLSTAGTQDERAPGGIVDIFFEFLSILNQDLNERRFIYTAEGYVGFAPATTEPGDVVCILLGVHLPVVLREMPVLGTWQVVGGCCVPGLMWGEAITGNQMPHRRPVIYKPEGIQDCIDGRGLRMEDSRDGSKKANPAEILKEHGIEVVKYQREPHRLEVSADTLRRAGVDLRDFDLV